MYLITNLCKDIINNNIKEIEKKINEMKNKPKTMFSL